MSSRKLRPVAVVLLGLTMALTACTGEPTPEPSPTMPAQTSTSPAPSPSPEPSTASPTPSPIQSSSPLPSTASASSSPTGSSETPTSGGDWTPPDPVDEAYATRVIQHLQDLDVPVYEMVLQMAKAGRFEISPELESAVSASRSDAEASDELLALSQTPADVALQNLADPPGAYRVVAVEILDETPDCIRGNVQFDPSALTPGFEEVSLQMRLVRGEGNETGWLIDDSGPDDSALAQC